MPQLWQHSRYVCFIVSALWGLWIHLGRIQKSIPRGLFLCIKIENPMGLHLCLLSKLYQKLSFIKYNLLSHAENKILRFSCEFICIYTDFQWKYFFYTQANIFCLVCVNIIKGNIITLSSMLSEVTLLYLLISPYSLYRWLYYGQHQFLASIILNH